MRQLLCLCLHGIDIQVLLGSPKIIISSFIRISFLRIPVFPSRLQTIASLICCSLQTRGLIEPSSLQSDWFGLALDNIDGK